MIRISIKNMELFERWVLSPSSLSNIVEVKGGYGGKWNGIVEYERDCNRLITILGCILTFKNGKKAIVQMK